MDRADYANENMEYIMVAAEARERKQGQLFREKAGIGSMIEAARRPRKYHVGHPHC